MTIELSAATIATAAATLGPLLSAWPLSQLLKRLSSQEEAWHGYIGIYPHEHTHSAFDGICMESLLSLLPLPAFLCPLIFPLHP